MSEKTEDWITDAAEAIARHVERARSPAFQMTTEFKIEEAHSFGCAAAKSAVKAERERCRRRVLEQRCERGTPWDRALLTAVEAIDNDKPVVAIREEPIR